MSTLIKTADEKVIGSSKTGEKNKPDLLASSNDVRKDQLSSFEQGLTEALLMSKGELKGTPLSDLWDE